jgi:hypothetical protein
MLFISRIALAALRISLIKLEAARQSDELGFIFEPFMVSIP